MDHLIRLIVVSSSLGFITYKIVEPKALIAHFICNYVALFFTGEVMKFLSKGDK